MSIFEDDSAYQFLKVNLHCWLGYSLSEAIFSLMINFLAEISQQTGETLNEPVINYKPKTLEQCGQRCIIRIGPYGSTA